MSNFYSKNKVTIAGTIVENILFSHNSAGMNFYKTKIQTKRMSGYSDLVPVLLPETIVNNFEVGDYVELKGIFHSFNLHAEDGSHLILNVTVNEAETLEIPHPADINDIQLGGYICKPVTFRKTPLGRDIADVLVAVHRPRGNGKSDYFPCILWSANAKRAAELNVGDRIMLKGRIQSRTYEKTLENDVKEERMAYEISVNKFKAFHQKEER